MSPVVTVPRQQRWSRGLDAGGLARTRSIVGGRAAAAVAAIPNDPVRLGRTRSATSTTSSACWAGPVRRGVAGTVGIVARSQRPSAPSLDLHVGHASRRRERRATCRPAPSRSRRRAASPRRRGEAPRRRAARAGHRRRGHDGARVLHGLAVALGRAAAGRPLPRRVPRPVGLGALAASRSRTRRCATCRSSAYARARTPPHRLVVGRAWIAPPRSPRSVPVLATRSRRSTAPARSRSRVAPGDPSVRGVDPRDAPRRVRRRREARRRGARASRRSRRRAREPSRRAHERSARRREEGARRSVPDARARARRTAADAAGPAARRRARTATGSPKRRASCAASCSTGSVPATSSAPSS